jgi:hypothetical protein
MQTTPEIDGSGSQSEIVRALWLKNYNAGGTNEGKTNGAPGRPDKGQAALTKAEWEQRAEIGRLRKAEKKARKAQIKAGLPVAPASMEVLTHQLSALKTDSTSDVLGLNIGQGHDEAVRSVLQNAASLSTSSAIASGGNISIGKRKKNWHNKPKRRNQARGACFARWMIDTFGHSALNSGTGQLAVQQWGERGYGGFSTNAVCFACLIFVRKLALLRILLLFLCRRGGRSRRERWSFF